MRESIGYNHLPLAPEASLNSVYTDLGAEETILLALTTIGQHIYNLIRKLAFPELVPIVFFPLLTGEMASMVRWPQRPPPSGRQGFSPSPTSVARFGGRPG